MKIGDQRAEILRMRKGEALDTIAAPLREGLDLGFEGALEAPFGLGPRRVGLGRRPTPNARTALFEKGGHARPALQVFVRGRSPECAHLEDVAILELRRRPLERAIDDADRRPGLEALLH